MLDLIDKTFHQMLFAIHSCVVVAQECSTLMGWDDHFNEMKVIHVFSIKNDSYLSSSPKFADRSEMRLFLRLIKTISM